MYSPQENKFEVMDIFITLTWLLPNIYMNQNMTLCLINMNGYYMSVKKIKSTLHLCPMFVLCALWNNILTWKKFCSIYTMIRILNFICHWIFLLRSLFLNSFPFVGNLFLQVTLSVSLPLIFCSFSMMYSYVDWFAYIYFDSNCKSWIWEIMFFIKFIHIIIPNLAYLFKYCFPYYFPLLEFLLNMMDFLFYPPYFLVPIFTFSISLSLSSFMHLAHPILFPWMTLLPLFIWWAHT
jgi:hypothetical protein